MYDEEGEPLVCMYKQFDGYIKNGLGQTLQRFLQGRRVVNGYGGNDEAEGAFNGMSNVATQVVWAVTMADNLHQMALKERFPVKGQGEGHTYPIGGIYLHRPSTPPFSCWDEYVYRIRPNGKGGLKLTVQTKGSTEKSLSLAGKALTPEEFFGKEASE